MVRPTIAGTWAPIGTGLFVSAQANPIVLHQRSNTAALQDLVLFSQEGLTLLPVGTKHCPAVALVPACESMARICSGLAAAKAKGKRIGRPRVFVNAHRIASLLHHSEKQKH